MRGKYLQLNQENSRYKHLIRMNQESKERNINSNKMNGLKLFKNKKVYRNFLKLIIKIKKVKKNKLRI